MSTDRIVLPTPAAVELFNTMAEAMRPDPAWVADVDRRSAEIAAQRAGKSQPAPAAEPEGTSPSCKPDAP